MCVCLYVRAHLCERVFICVWMGKWIGLAGFSQTSSHSRGSFGGGGPNRGIFVWDVILCVAPLRRERRIYFPADRALNWARPPRSTFSLLKTPSKLYVSLKWEWSILKTILLSSSIYFLVFFISTPSHLSGSNGLSLSLSSPFLLSCKLGTHVHSAKWPLMQWMEEMRWALDL